MKAFGIDLGTTNSVISYYSKGTVVVVPIEGNRLVPSVVYIDEAGNKIVGQNAKRRILLDPAHVLSSTKREIGSKWKKPISRVNHSPTDAATDVLAYIKREAEKTLGENVENVVVTVPAYFTDEQRRQTLIAAEAAKLKVLRLLPEPTAAAVCHGFNKEKDQVILVVDLGGGTFDVSVLEVKANQFIVKTTAGDNRLGGDDFDNAIVEYLNQWVEQNTGKNIRKDANAQQRLKEEAEKTKIELSSSKATNIWIDLPGGINIDIEGFKVDEYKKLIAPYLTKITEKVKEAINSAKISVDDINRFVLVGGSCKHPVVRELITENFKSPYFDDDMDTSVSRGAAIVCHSLLQPTHEDAVEFGDVIPHSLGIDMNQGSTDLSIFVPILKRNDRYPAKGVIMGYTRPGQDEAKMRIYRGEHLNDVERNTKLGELSLPIGQKHIERPNAVAAIFNLDQNMILTFTGVEIPLDDSMLSDSLIRNLMEQADNNNSKVSYADISRAIDKHKLKTKEVVIKVN